MFLDEKIPFTAIAELIDSALQAHKTDSSPDLDDYIEADRLTRIETEKRISNYA